MKHSLKRFASLSLAVVLTMQVFSVAPLQVAAVDSQGIQELYKGLTYEAQSFENTDDANVNAFVITVDTAANPDLAFVAGSPNDEQPLKEGLQQTTSDQAKAAALNGRNVLAAVNADFFNINDSDKIQPTGLMIQDGVELTPYYQFTGPDDPEHGVRLFFGVTDDGEAIIGDENTYEERKDELYQAVGGRYLLVDEGKAQTYDGDISFETERAPRTAVGIREDGSVLLVVIDGRNSGGSAGTTLAETADYMVELGAETALNLDGGGSSTAVIKNPETRNYEVKNVPSDGKERPVGNTLLVIDTSEESTSVDLEQDDDGYYLLTAPEDFREILDGPSEDYRLAASVDFSEMENFTIGMFDGTFDGDGHTIENLTATDIGSGYALFDSITDNAEIRDLKLEDVSIENPNTSYTAALVGNCSGTVRNVTVTGEICGNDYVGAIAGNVLGTGKLERCSAGAVVSGNAKVGGLAGQITGTADACYVNCQVTGVNNVGGVTGYALDNAGGTRLIQNCIVEGSVSCSGIEAGGIAGLAKVTIRNNVVRNMAVSSTGQGTPGSGNVAGLLGAWMQNLPQDLSITGNVVLSGSVSAPSPAEGYRLGKSNKPAQVYDNYANPGILVNGKTVEGASNDGNGQNLTDDQMRSKDFFAGLGFDFETVFSWNDETGAISLQNADQQVRPPVPATLLDSTAQWRYLDDNTDPAAGEADRTAWTAPDFDDQSWKTAVGAFGSKRGNAFLEEGYTASTILDGCSGSNDYTTYFFRTTFQIDSLDGMTALQGTLQHDDAAIVYINGKQVAAYDADEITQNMQYAGVSAGTPKTQTFSVTDMSLLREGENTIAVELHNDRASSSDIWFYLTDLHLSDEETAADQNSLSMSIGADGSQMNFTWYSDDAQAGTLLLAKQSELDGGAMPEDAESFQAEIRQANRAGYYTNQLTVTGLEPDTVYAYQLVNNGTESEIHTFTTGGDNDSFSFALAGDPQIGASGNAGNDANGWEKTLEIVADDPSFENVDFLLSAGDQVNTASDESQYTGYLEHGELAELPVATVIGNHDSSSDAYGEHFNVPNEDATLGQTTAGGDYYFVYDNTLFMVLNSNNMSTAEHKSFMQKAIEETAAQDIQWKVVTFHHSIYSMASHVNDSDIIERRNQLPQVFKELDIDVVLMGHDHVYTRTYMMDGPNPILESDKYTDTDGNKIPEAVTDPDGILYVTVNSASGSKFYNIQSNTDYQWAAVINQEKVPNISRVDITDDSFTITTYRTSDLSVVDTFTINRTSAEPAKQIEAFENGNSSLNLTAIARYDSGMTNADGGVMEIVDYNAETGYAYAINGQAGTLAAISLADLEKGETIQQLEGNTVDVKRLVQVDGFIYGDMTSVAISPDGTTLAAAVQAAGYADNGRVVLFACGADGTLTFQQAIETGVQPDMVTFTPDGSKILTANEGEPREGYTATDPQGSVTVIEVKTLQAQTIGFETYDTAEARQALTNAGVLLKKETNPSVDFEPEYIAATDTMAYVTLQEANAIAVLDLGSLAFTGVYSAGFEDYSKTPVDIDKKDGAYAPKTYEGLLGIRMPDAISLYEADGKTYLLTANEGDAREWGDYLNEAEVNFGKEGAQSPAGNLTQDSGLSGKVVFFKTEDFDGLQNGKDYLFGGRSFTLYQVNADGLTEVFTSADDFESRTAEYLGDYFNCSNDNLDLDDRSGKKGPEPETVTVGEVDGKTYAFITLERIGGVMVYDITDPQDMSYVNYINSRDFSKELGADDSPEGLKFIPASQSPTEEALLLAACEVGGTVAVYELTAGEKDQGGNQSGGSSSGTGGRHPVQTEEPFTDVQMDDWFYNAVVYVVKNGLMNGVTNTQFSPDTATTRGMIVTILYRMAGKPAADGTSFADVEQDAYYADAVAWAAESGIVMGYGDGTFGPNDSITREQMATMLYRYAGSPAVTQTALQFADSGEVSSYATNAISWAVQQGILSGKTGNILDPQGDATRAQVAQMLQNYLQ